ncbi:hypothetical protein [Methylocaldum szegediense]|uniref:Uncharacterized protein n=1 Tax=Methylocaldum szegediense TaxID=73780 RepID=A0ABM9HWC6_9GAMM|nr:hypothetical protein [Methylocaldum szegediense]CAI8729679.1 exported protein of unknown function [Methylocaldum szegediense]
MTVNPGFFSSFKPLLLVAALAAAPGFDNAAAAADSDASRNPWAVNLTLYAWLPGVDGRFSPGQFSKSVEATFIDISEELRNFPRAFMGRLEAHYERLGFYLDGNYVDLDFEPRFARGISRGLSSQLGVLEYSAMYRVFGSAASERIARWGEKPRSNALELYAGGRTLWLDNQVEFRGIGSASASKSLTSPVIGAVHGGIQPGMVRPGGR